MVDLVDLFMQLDNKMIIWYNDSDRMNHKSNFYYYIGRNFFAMGKALSFKVNDESEVELIKKHLKNYGFDNINSYLKYLVNEDLKKVDLSTTTVADEKKVLIEGLVNRLSDEELEKVIDYIKLLLK